MNNMAGIADSATRNVLQILLDQNIECERRLANAFQRIEAVEERDRHRLDRISVLERTMREAGVSPPSGD